MPSSLANPWSDRLFVVQLRGPAAALDVAVELFSTLEADLSTWQHAEEATGLVSLYTESPEAAETVRGQVVALLAEAAGWLPAPLELLPIAALDREDWSESWKRYFHPLRISDRLSICPSWEKPDPVAGQLVIVLDPGNSFGTGQHGTTVACLRFLDDLAGSGAAGPVADMGCGSGILAIGAVLLGLGPVDAFDYDPVAVGTAGENCAINGVSSSVTVSQADLGAWQPAHPYPIVVANILAPVLVEHAGILAAAVDPAPAGRLILSGILVEQFDGVAAAFAACGFVLERALVIDVWKSGIFRRR